MEITRREKGLQAGILVLAALLRWPLPEPGWMHGDEGAFIERALGFWSGDLNPHFFNYPTLQFYLVSLAYYIYFLLFADEPIADFIAWRYFVEAGDLLAIARGLTTLMAVATVAATMCLGRRLYGTAGGLCAGAVLALMPLHVRFSHLAITDVPATLWATLAVLWAVRLRQGGRPADCVIAGIFVGLAAATKYPAGLAALPLLVAIGWSRRLWAAGAAALLTFAAATPYVWLDGGQFWADFTRMGQEHLLSQTHSTAEPAPLYHLRYSLRYGLGVVGLLAVVGALVWKPRSWRREEGVVVAGIAGFAALLVLAESTFLRYALPLAPLLAVLIARPLPSLDRRWALALGLVLAEPAYASLQTRFLMTAGDTRVRAQQWLREQLPEGGRLLRLPLVVGQVRVLDPISVHIRRRSFAASYGKENLERAYALLRQRDDLPPLYVYWEREAASAHRAVASATDSIAVLWYSHPLFAPAKAATIEGSTRWLAHYTPGAAEKAVFDWVDSYYLPIGGWGAMEGTGPAIRLGVMPLGKAPALPDAGAFFALLEACLQVDRAVAREDWTGAMRLGERVFAQGFFLPELMAPPALHRLYMGLGQAHRAAGELEVAIDLWLRAIEAVSSAASAYHNIAMAYDDLGMDERAAHYYREAAQRDAADVNILYNLGVSYIKLARYEDGIRVLERVVARQPDADAYINLGIAYGHTGRGEKQRTCFSKALETDPDHPQAAALRQAIQEGP